MPTANTPGIINKSPKTREGNKPTIEKGITFFLLPGPNVKRTVNSAIMCLPTKKGTKNINVGLFKILLYSLTPSVSVYGSTIIKSSFNMNYYNLPHR